MSRPMLRRRKSPLWPWMGVLATLFVVSVTVRPTWRQTAPPAPLISAENPSSTSSQPGITPPVDVVALANHEMAAPERRSEVELVPQHLVASAELSPLPEAMAHSIGAITGRKPTGIAVPVLSTPRVHPPPAIARKLALSGLSTLAPPDPSQVPPPLPPSTTRAPRVRVSGPDDRLAMLPTRLRARRKPHKVFTPPVALLDELQRLGRFPRLAAWTQEVRHELDVLTALTDQDVDQLIESIDRLAMHSQQAAVLAAGARMPSVRTALLRARYAIDRRIAVWREAPAAIVMSRPTARDTVEEDQDSAAQPPWAEFAKLLYDVEHYEAKRLASVGNLLAQHGHMLAESDIPFQRRLSHTLQENYRNANIRVAVSGSFVERFLPKVEPIAQPVHDMIAGARVKGRSVTDTQLGLRLIPDPNYLRFGIEARGTVASSTQSSAGPATFHNAGRSAYEAAKLVVVTSKGVYRWPAVANARPHTQLRDVQTKYDNVPLIGDIARSMAAQQHERARGQALAQMRERITTQVKVKLDREVDKGLVELERVVRAHLFSPLQCVGLSPQPIDMTTTPTQLVARLRVAGDDQIAAHTPRPRAPDTSVASVQIHESVLNNFAQQLKLDGATYKVSELRALLREKLGLAPPTNAEELPERAEVTFAARDAVRVFCDDGQLEIVLAVKVIRQGRRKLQNFKLHAYYRPALDGMRIRLVRDGGLGVEGRRITLGQRGVLQGIFNNLFAKDRPITLFSPATDGLSRFEGLSVSQFVIDEGWVGIAVSTGAPHTLARQSAALTAN